MAPCLRARGAVRRRLADRADAHLDDAGIALGIDATVTAGGAFYIEGWIDDRGSALAGLSLVDFATGRREHLPTYRVRRPDVESHLQASRPREFGF